MQFRRYFPRTKPFLIASKPDVISSRFRSRFRSSGNSLLRNTLHRNVTARCLNRAVCNTQQSYSPPRRGKILDRELANPTSTDPPHRETSFSLSLAALPAALPAVLAHRRGRSRRRSGSGERAGVRGNGATFVSMAERFPGIVKLDESPGRAGGFPRRMTGRGANRPRSVV